MQFLAEFFHSNRVIVYFVYGEAFFVLGLALALQTRKHSQLALARRLWLLSTFGFVHAFYEWGTVFIPLQTYLPDSVTGVLQFLQLVLGALSFLALFQFGVELILLGLNGSAWLSMVPPVIFVVWAMVTLTTESMTRTTLDAVLISGEVLARYILAVPGALAAALGLAWQAQQVREMDMPRIAQYFRAAAYAFGAYAVVSAIVPRADYFPASVFNYDAVANTIGVPVPVFRALLGGTIAYLIIRGSEIFDVETDRMLEEIAQAQAVATDRERIGRELHDSIIQSLYAAGLMLEDASYTIDEDKARAQDRIRDVIGALNRTIRDIRRYILDLRGETNTGDLAGSLQELVRTFRLETLVDAEFHRYGSSPFPLTREECDHLLTITREALTNVTKHAQATRVDVTLQSTPAELELDIADNGVGFARNGHDSSEAVPAPTVMGEHQGLRNMQERAEIIGATLTVDSVPGQGTTVRTVVPAARQRMENGSQDNLGGRS